MKLPIIEPNITKFTKVTNIIMGFLAVALLINISTWNFKNGNNYIGGTLGISIVGLGLYKMVRSFVIKDYKKVGRLDLEIDNIGIIKKGSKEIYYLRQIDSINVHYYGYDGESYPISSVGEMNIRQHNGDKNRFNIVINGVLTENEFYLDKYEEKIQFFKHLFNYEKQGVRLNFTNEFGSNEIYKNS